MKKIENIHGKEPFKVPENYFEEVNSKIISSTAGYEHEIGKNGFYNRFRTYILVAASVTGFILISYTALRLLSPSRSERMLTEALNEQSPDSLLYELDLYSLEESVAAISFTTDKSGAEKSEIVDYLLFENIEASEIYEML